MKVIILGARSSCCRCFQLPRDILSATPSSSWIALESTFLHHLARARAIDVVRTIGTVPFRFDEIAVGTLVLSGVPLALQ